MWNQRLFFAVLYFVQGAALAYIVNFQKPFLASQGISKESLGLFTSLLLVPFILKVFLGALSDRVPILGGSRKPYMVMGLSLFALCYFSLAWIDPKSSFFLFACVTWMASLGLALFDTCADGWAVDVAGEDEAANIQASMIGGKSLGFVAMSLGFGALGEIFGFRYVFMAISAIAILVLFRILGAQHHVGHKSSTYEVDWKDLKSSAYLVFAVFGILYSVASFGTDGLYTLYLADVRIMGNMDLGYYGVGRGFGALLGAAGFAVSIRHLNIRRAQILSLIVLGMGCLTPLLNLPLSIAGAVWGVCWGFQETAFVTVAMGFARGKWAATFFAISMIFSNIGTSVGEALGAPMVPRFGYQGVFLSFAVIAWACLILVPWFATNKKSGG